MREVSGMGTLRRRDKHRDKRRDKWLDPRLDRWRGRCSGAAGARPSWKFTAVHAAAWAVWAAAAAIAPDAVAQDKGGDAVTRWTIHQPAQPLAEALRVVARQTGASLIFDPRTVEGIQTGPVSGRLSVREAVEQLLRGTGLQLAVQADGALVVQAAGAGGNGSSAAPLEAPRPGSSPSSAIPARGAVAVQEAQSQKVQVTGSRLKQVEADGPVPVNTYTREDIDRSGQPSLERFLSGLNEVSMSAGEGGSGTTLGQGTVQLRGLPQGSTLVLINGRRVQAVGSSSANFFNLNLIPLEAVERIEVVPVGSSAIYGGDALAGVVNVILRSSMDGVALRARIGAADGTEDQSLSLATGDAGAEWSYLVMATASRATPLTMAERAFFRDGDYRRFGGADVRGTNCTPGTVSSTDGSNLPGLDAPLAGIPALAGGQPPGVDDYRATAGQPNLCNVRAGGRGLALVHGNESYGLHATGERWFNARWAAFGELTYADDRLRAEEMGIALTNVLVPAENLYNPFGVPVRVTSMLGAENGLRTFSRHTRFTRLLGGLRGELDAGWDVELTASTSRDESLREATLDTLVAAERDAALAAPSPDAALNPFTAGRAASDEVLAAIWPGTEREGRGRKDQLGGFLRGPLLRLPAGPVEAIFGAEATRDEFVTVITGPTGQTKADTRRAHAAFAELRAPLVKADAVQGRPWNLAALTLAGRHDRYSDFGSASTWQAGLELRPARTLLLRASTATSFKPPTLAQMNVDSRGFPALGFGYVDPARGNEPIVDGEVLRATNPDLGPERGRAASLGAVWEPAQLTGTRFGLSAWQVKVDGLIGILDPQLALRYEDLFPGFVTRGPSVDGQPGAVTQLLYAEVNYGRVDTAGFDLEAAHSWQAAGSRWSLAGGATRMSRYQVAVRPDTPAESRLGRRFRDYWAPEWKANLSLGLAREGWGVRFTSRYLGSYLDAGTSTRELGGHWTHDLGGQVDLQRLGLGFQGLKSATLSLAIANLTGREPEYVESVPNYDITQADWRGRYVSLRLALDW